MSTDGRSQAESVAEWYMRHKGYLDVVPNACEKIPDLPCWYFYYELPDGRLELEVFWSGTEWQTCVTTFAPSGPKVDSSSR